MKSISYTKKFSKKRTLKEDDHNQSSSKKSKTTKNNRNADKDHHLKLTDSDGDDILDDEEEWVQQQLLDIHTSNDKSCDGRSSNNSRKMKSKSVSSDVDHKQKSVITHSQQQQKQQEQQNVSATLSSQELLNSQSDVILLDDDITTVGESSTTITGDFHKDTGLCPMLHEVEKNEHGNAYHIIVDQGVLTGIVDHVYSDTTNEILGLLGGVYDSISNTVHIKHYCASIRDVNNIAIDGVECDGNEVVKAQTNFAEKNLLFVGWYHSHPRIPPFPSMKDLGMQHEMQLQAPYAVGIICSPYYNESTKRVNSDKHTFYFNCFRTRPTPSASMTDIKLEALNVMCTINQQPYITPNIQREMQKTLRTSYNETREIFSHLKKKFCGCDAINGTNDHQHKSNNNDDLNSVQYSENLKSIYLSSQYQSFLFSFWKDSISQSGITLKQDIQVLQESSRNLEVQLEKKRKFLLKHMSEEEIALLLSSLTMEDANSSGTLYATDILPSTDPPLSINTHEFLAEEKKNKELIMSSKSTLGIVDMDDEHNNTSTSTGVYNLSQELSQSIVSETAASSSSVSSKNTSPKKQQWTFFGSLGRPTQGDYEYYTSVTYRDTNYEIKDYIAYHKPGEARRQQERIGQIIKVIEHKSGGDCSLEVRCLLAPDSPQVMLPSEKREQFGEDELYMTDIPEFVNINQVLHKARLMKYDDYIGWKFTLDDIDIQNAPRTYYCAKLYDSKKHTLSNYEPEIVPV